LKPAPTVFVVDDDWVTRKLLGRVLPSFGIPVRTFASASELLETADLRSPCVLLLDVNMPGMSGPELQLVLKERGFTVPIIFLTASSDVPVAVAAMRNGAVDFLEKPFDTEVLIARVRQTLDHLDTGALRSPSSEYASRLDTLTPREREVLVLMVTGRTSKLIAREIGGSFRTIEIHRARIMSKMGAASLADLVRMKIDGDDAPGASSTSAEGPDRAWP
jgi:two-component system, LuxR family, response regulator FixJ